MVMGILTLKPQGDGGCMSESFISRTWSIDLRYIRRSEKAIKSYLYREKQRGFSRPPWEDLS